MMTMDRPAPLEPRWDAAIALPPRRADRPVTLSHRLENRVASAVWAWSARRDVDVASDALGRVARRLGPLLRPVHRRGQSNMAAGLADLRDADREAALRDEWENLGRTAAEYPHLPSLAARTEIVGADTLADLANNDGQAIFVSGHFANWEVMAAALHAAGLKTAVVYRAANNPLVDQRIIEMRAAAMSRVLIPKGKRGGRALLAAIKDGLSPCLLTDQRLSDGVDATLLGRPALTAPAAARLALRADLPVIPLQIVRGRGARFTMTVHAPIEAHRTGDMAADTLALTQAINDRLGDFISQTPGQWLWFHRRWKPRG